MNDYEFTGLDTNSEKNDPAEAVKHIYRYDMMAEMGCYDNKLSKKFKKNKKKTNKKLNMLSKKNNNLEKEISELKDDIKSLKKYFYNEKMTELVKSNDFKECERIYKELKEWGE